MRIAFGDFSGWDFHAQSVETMPLGGSQSAACYLAQALARSGHAVFFFTMTSAPGTYEGVVCLSWSTTPLDRLRALNLDAFVCILAPGNGTLLREMLDARTRLILWTQHRFDQAAMQPLAQLVERDSYDAFVFVSDWHREEFLTHFVLPRERTTVLRNAAAPTFLDVLTANEPILAQKSVPPVLAYTSTPFRGLDLLLEAFPVIRAHVPEVRLRVYSSMRVYQLAHESDAQQYGALYARCRQTPGIEYIGSLAQPALAREMRGVTALVYPNTFAETSCISALEAMAAGCRVITSALGALPETCAGFAELIPVGPIRVAYLEDFVERTVAVLRAVACAEPAVEMLLRRQVQYIRENATWDSRASLWCDWLMKIGESG